jgi:hypothetical protein
VDFSGARLKVARAAEHLARLEAIAADYLSSNPFTLGYRYDVATAEHVALLQELAPPPPSMALTTGEFVQSLRTALDYLVAALINCATGAPPPEDSKFEFPIFLNSKDYESAKRKKLVGVDPEDVTLIDSLQPFTAAEPAKHPLWMLHRLNIADKHRSLHVVAGALWSTGVQHIGAGGARAFSIDAKWIMDPLRFPLASGTELLRYRSESSLPGEVSLEFQPTLLFDEPLEAHRWFVQPLLASLYDNIFRIVEALASCWPE